MNNTTIFTGNGELLGLIGTGEPLPDTVTEADLAVVLTAVEGINLPTLNADIACASAPFNWANVDPSGEDDPLAFGHDTSYLQDSRCLANSRAA